MLAEITREYRKAITVERKRKLGQQLLEELGFDYSTGNNGVHCYGVIEEIRFDFWPTTYRLTISSVEDTRKHTVEGFGNLYSLLLKLKRFIEEEEMVLNYDTFFKR